MWSSHPGRRGPFPVIPGIAMALGIIVGGATPAWSGGLYPLGETTEVSRLSDEPVPFATPPDLPDRPRLLWEFGDPFLDTGNLTHGFEVPGGAVWQPRLWIFGTLRTAVQTFDNGARDRISEWATRLDLYANLALTGTEKIIVGIRPLDKNRPNEFSRCIIEPDQDDGCEEEFNANIRTLFFEGDLGSLLPNLDPGGITALDFGFSVGRQLLQFQEGIMINDEVDALGIVRNNIRLPGISNLRVSGVWGWNELDRPGARGDPRRSNETAQMFGLFNSADLQVSTVNLDVIYVDDGEPNGTSFNIGAAAIQRIGHLNTAFRINSSIAKDADTPQVADGTLLSAELSWTPTSSDDIVYMNPFIAIDTFTQAGREPVVGGPLGALGILFASPSLGNFGSELSSFANEVAGIAIGYQAFWQNHRRNLVLEIAARKDTEGNGLDEGALGFQFQQRLAQHVQFQLDGHYALQENRDNGYGARTEILIQF